MKTKVLLFICVFLGVGLIQITAQPANGETGSVSFFSTWYGYYVDIPVNCNNNEVERLVGNVTIHTVYHYQNYDQNIFDWVWVRQEFDGEVENSLTHEVFKVKDVLTSTDFLSPATGHFNLKGNQGSHYIVTYIYDGSTDSFTFVKATCN